MTYPHNRVSGKYLPLVMNYNVSPVMKSDHPTNRSGDENSSGGGDEYVLCSNVTSVL